MAAKMAALHMLNDRHSKYLELIWALVRSSLFPRTTPKSALANRELLRQGPVPRCSHTVDDQALGCRTVRPLCPFQFTLCFPGSTGWWG
jgi:hypothetical protein